MTINTTLTSKNWTDIILNINKILTKNSFQLKYLLNKNKCLINCSNCIHSSCSSSEHSDFSCFKTFSTKNCKFCKNQGIQLTGKNSLFIFPQEINTDSFEIKKILCSLKILDKEFIKDRKKFPYISFQYFGTNYGITQIYPGRHYCGKFDNRKRPWCFFFLSFIKN